MFHVRIRTQGHDLVVEGASPDLDRVDRVVGQLSSLMRDGYKLSNADVKTASDLVAQDVAVDLRDHFLKGSLTPGGKRRIAPKTVTQRKYLDAIEQHDIVFAIGPAGTGKTYLAMAQAVAFLVAKKVSRIILDEAQNTTPEQMKMFLTRLGFGSKVVVNGDITQIYLPSGTRSGLVIVQEILSGIEGIRFVHLGAKDVVRHRIVQNIVEAYRAHGERSATSE